MCTINTISMTELKILVHNINDVVNRAAFEKELNVYLKMGWSLRDTHQAVSPGTGFLMMTAVLEKEAEEENKETESSGQGAVKEESAGEKKTTESSKQEAESSKEKAEDSKQEKEESTEQKAEKEENSEEKEKGREAKETATETPKGFKIKEKKEDD